MNIPILTEFMSFMKNYPKPPLSLEALTQSAFALAGKKLGELGEQVGIQLPSSLCSHKGLAGQLIEYILGGEAGNQSKPDFINLGIELKTIPVNAAGRPKESTYVCTVPLSQRPYEKFETSVVLSKLSHVLWVPIMTQASAVSDWTILKPIFWQPNEAALAMLRTDFDELMDAIALGGLENITSRMGEALHIRPKAADGKQLTSFVGSAGVVEQTLPRGFYLRTRFTAEIMKPSP